MSNTMKSTYTADGTSMYSPLPSAGGGGDDYAAGNNYPTAATATENLSAGGSEVAKRKRGRPPASMKSSESSSVNKARGRPPGSRNKRHPAASASASGSPGAGLMPHILEVKAGEDVLGKLMAWFSENSTRAACILSSKGAISSVTLEQPATSAGTVTYEGHFEMISLSGLFTASKSGDLTVALSGPDGRVLGGTVAGSLIAASPLQVVLGRFIPVSEEQLEAIGSPVDG